MTPEPINWAQGHVDEGPYETADKAMELCDHWRNLAHHLREENRRLRADLERLTHPGEPWPFR